MVHVHELYFRLWNYWIFETIQREHDLKELVQESFLHDKPFKGILHEIADSCQG